MYDAYDQWPFDDDPGTGIAFERYLIQAGRASSINQATRPAPTYAASNLFVDVRGNRTLLVLFRAGDVIPSALVGLPTIPATFDANGEVLNP